MNKSKIFVCLFGLPFLAVGIWAAWSIGHSFYDWQRMKSWEPVQAHILSGGYDSHSGDDATTFSAFAHYSYTFNGQTYTGDRAAIESGSDNVGDFQTELGAKLSAAQGQDMEIYVDPERPDQSVVNRDLRWAMIGFKAIFLVAFGGFGALAFFGAMFVKTKSPQELAQPIYQEQPWLLNDAWQTRDVGSSSKSMVYFTWFFATMWNAISAPIPFLLKGELEKGNYPALIGLLFPLIGAGLLVWAVRKTLEWKRFGAAPVMLDPFPGSIGGNVGGTIEFNLPYDPAAQFIATLRCLKSEYRRRNSDSSRQEITIWQDERVCYTEMGNEGTRVIFRFDVPDGLEQSDATKAARDYYMWRVTIRADIAGTDVDRDYEIPVYATKQKSASIPERVVDASERATIDMDDKQARARIHTRPGIQGDEIFYPMGRNIGAALTGMIVGICFAAPGAFLIWHEHMPFFGGLFFAVGALIFFCCLYMPVNSLTISNDVSGGITTVRCILGFPVKKRYAARDDIQFLTYESHMSTNSGRGEDKQFTIYANLPGAKKIVVGEGFCGEGEAKAAVTILSEKFGIRK